MDDPWADVVEVARIDLQAVLDWARGSIRGEVSENDLPDAWNRLHMALARPDDEVLPGLLQKLMLAGVQYAASSRYGGWDEPPSVRTYGGNEVLNLSNAEEDLLRGFLGRSRD